MPSVATAVPQKNSLFQLVWAVSFYVSEISYFSGDINRFLISFIFSSLYIFILSKVHYFSFYFLVCPSC